MHDEAMQSLDEVLSGAEPKAPAAAVEPPGDKPTETTLKPDDKPLDVTKPDDKAPPPDAKKVEAEPKEDWTKAAVLDERRKRQELERKLAELEGKKAPAADQPKRPDLFEDPEGALNGVKTEIRMELFAARIEQSQELMRSLHTDYDELETEFYDLAKDNPILLKGIAEAKNPAKYAYDMAQKARQFTAISDTDKYRAEIEAKHLADIEARVRREFEERYGKEQKKREATGEPSLAATTAKGSTSAVPDESLDSILKR